MDGFQAWKQRGFEEWPIIVTILNLDPSSRVRIASQVIVGITSNPAQPADMESFLHPIANELNALAAGVSGLEVAGYPDPQVMFAFVVQFTTDMPAGDKLLNAVGTNGERPGKLRDFAGFRAHHRFWYPPYQPLYDPSNPPPSKRRRLDVQGDATPRRTAASMAGSVSRVENARRAGQSQSAVRALA